MNRTEIKGLPGVNRLRDVLAAAPPQLTAPALAIDEEAIRAGLAEALAGLGQLKEAKSEIDPEKLRKLLTALGVIQPAPAPAPALALDQKAPVARPRPATLDQTISDWLLAGKK